MCKACIGFIGELEKHKHNFRLKTKKQTHLSTDILLLQALFFSNKKLC
jgi:hypothetical protein